MCGNSIKVEVFQEWFTTYGANFCLLSNGAGAGQNIMVYSGEKKEDDIPIENTFTYDIPKRNIEIEKVDAADTSKKLSGVKFKFQHVATGKYLYKQTNGTITYVDPPTEEQNNDPGFIWVTGVDGKLTEKITNVLAGDYLAIETENPNKLYDWVGNVTILANENIKQIGNKQKYVNLSGYVWDEIGGGKGGSAEERNSLYDEESKDSKIKGVRVSLKNKTTNEIVKDKNGTPYQQETR